VKYLGYVVGNGTLNIDRDKTSAIVDFPTPKSVKHLRRFLGMAGWYRRSINNFSSVTAPLTDSFEQLKAALSNAPILENPDYSRPFLLQRDARKTGIGAVLAQLFFKKIKQSSI